MDKQNRINTGSTNYWSELIQGVDTLYWSRRLRFSPRTMADFTRSFDIDKIAHNGGNLLEIGCGPGALLEALGEWYPNLSLIGCDIDKNFISFARSHAKGAEVVYGNVGQLPFDDGSFDVTISNTVCEHVNPASFFGQQHRVLKTGGVCLVLSSRKTISFYNDDVSETERQFWDRLNDWGKSNLEKYNVCAYPMKENEIPRTMEKYGFTNIGVDYVTVNLTPDDGRFSPEEAHMMINSRRWEALENVRQAKNHGGDLVSAREAEEMVRLINARFDERIRKYDSGIRLWDGAVSVIMVVRGVK